jgi:hypothetical protein
MEKYISVSLIDYIGQVENGIAVLLSLMILEKQYEIIYWFDQNNNFTITLEDSFYKNFPKIKNIYEYEYLIDLIYYIDTQILPEKCEIFKEFLKD